MRRELDRQKYTPRTILDFGCGVGGVTPYIRQYFPDAHICGADVSERSINVARGKSNKNTTFISVGELPQSAASFDLVFISNVFHHARPDEHKKMLEIIRSKMNPHARIFIFEINPYNPATRHVFNKYEKPIDKNANMVSSRYMNKLMRDCGFKTSWNVYTIFFPHFLRLFIPLEKYLRWLPLGAHYYVLGVNENV
jgi:trans-aconitate methyltransferase